jgi:hypothetical protein
LDCNDESAAINVFLANRREEGMAQLSTLGIEDMKSKALSIAASMTILVSCTSNHGNQTASTSSGQFNNPALSADTNARLKKIERDYGVGVGVNVKEHKIFLAYYGLAGHQPINGVTYWDALKTALGDDFTNYTFLPPITY